MLKNPFAHRQGPQNMFRIHMARCDEFNNEV